MTHFKRIFVIFTLLVMFISGAESAGADGTIGPNRGCPSGWQRLSFQSWWQKGINGVTIIPQALPDSKVGGHLHVETCFPVNLQVDGNSLALTVNIMTHQKFTGVGSRLDIGLAPGGSSLVAVPVSWDSRCPSGSCKTTVNLTVPLGGVGSGKQILRLRYLSTNHPNGERQFASNELPFSHNTAPVGCYETEGKGWYDTPRKIEYARAGIRTCLPGYRAVSGNYTFTQSARSTNYPISVIESHVDARFGIDDFSGTIDSFKPASSVRSLRRTVVFDTTKVADGWHCLSVLTQVPDPSSDGVNTGVMEFPILVNNTGGGDAFTGHGGCFSPSM